MSYEPNVADIARVVNIYLGQGGSDIPDIPEEHVTYVVFALDHLLLLNDRPLGDPEEYVELAAAARRRALDEVMRRQGET